MDKIELVKEMIEDILSDRTQDITEEKFYKVLTVEERRGDYQFFKEQRNKRYKEWHDAVVTIDRDQKWYAHVIDVNALRDDNREVAYRQSFGLKCNKGKAFLASLSRYVKSLKENGTIDEKEFKITTKHVRVLLIDGREEFYLDKYNKLLKSIVDYHNDMCLQEMEEEEFEDNKNAIEIDIN